VNTIQTLMTVLLVILVLAALGVTISVMILRHQRDVQRFEPMFERLLSELRSEANTRTAMQQMRAAARDHFRAD